jgi:hypothetical protein
MENVDITIEKQEVNKPRKGFQPGQSGNPNGRPPGTYSLVTILKKKLAEAVKKGGKQAGEELVELWLEKAKKEKNFDALKEIVRYVEGRPKQTTDITSGGKPIPLLDLTKK